MADVQVTSAELRDGVLTVSGSAMTKTTTTLYVDGAATPFETAVDFDGTEITAQVESASEVYAEKAGIESERVQVTQASAGDPQTGATGSAEDPSQTTSAGDPSAPEPSTSGEGGSGEPYTPTGDAHEPGYKTAEPNVTPGDLVKDDLEGGADVDPVQMGEAGATGAGDKNTEANQPDREPLKADEHLPGKDFRFKVENTKAEDLGKIIGPRDPYPKDNPPDPKEAFYRIHGHYQED